MHSRLRMEDLSFIMGFMKSCLLVCSEDEFHALIREFARYFGFEYVMYVYMKSLYSSGNQTFVVNVSNPEKWMKEYGSRNYIEQDPVRHEIEIRKVPDGGQTFILWDGYDRELSPVEREIIERRRHHGLNYGCTMFDNSISKELAFAVSFASAQTRVEPHVEVVLSLIIHHLTITRKKLDFIGLTRALSAREKEVAALLSKGGTNGGIAHELCITEATVKFHLSNIFTKLKVSNRQEAISILLAVRYLCF